MTAPNKEPDPIEIPSFRPTEVIAALLGLGFLLLFLSLLKT
jgi:hypothetical protein